jgi:hypothetical protein
MKLIKYLKIFVINILIILILLIIFDSLLNFRYSETKINNIVSSDDDLLSRRSYNIREYIPNLDRYVIPSKNYLSEAKTLENKKYRIRTNNDGFIIGEQNINLDKNKIDIIFFGGSTTNCLYVDEDKRFPYLVQKTLNRELNNDIQILNAGVYGKTSMLSTMDLITKGLKNNPEIVFLMHNINDFSVLEKSGKYWDAPISRSLIKQKIHIEALSSSNFFIRTFYVLTPNIYYIINRFFEILLNNKPNDEFIEYRNSEKIDKKIIFQEYIKSIKTFIAIAKIYEIEVVLMTQFNRMNIDDEYIVQLNSEIKNFEEYIYVYDQLNNLVREIANEENINLIDLDLLLPQNENYIYDEVHLNNNGSIFVADLISNFLIENYYNK